MNPIELLSTVTNFYDQAFNRLMAVTFGVIAFIGVLVPIVVGWVQTKSLKSEKGSLLNELRQEIASEREGIRKTIEASVRTEMSELRGEIETKIAGLSKKLEVSAAGAEAKAFHLQGSSRLAIGIYDAAVSDFARAASLYLDAQEESNAQTCISLVVEDCLPKVNANKYKKSKLDQRCEELLNKLRECNENNRYTKSIHKIESEMEDASQRQAPVQAGGNH